MSSSTPSRLGSRWRTLCYAVILPLLGAALTAQDATPTKHGYGRAAFVHQYDHGIYRYRVLAREIVLGLGALFHATLPALTPMTHHGYSLFSAELTLNAVAFVAVALLLYRLTVRSPQWLHAYVVVILAMIVSETTLPPYDFLSYVLIAAAVLLAFSGHRYAVPGCFVLSVLGVLTRESFFVAVAAVIAVALVSSPRRRRAPIVALLVGSLGTYVVLRLLLPGNHLFLQYVWVSANRHLGDLPAVIIAGLVVTAVYWALSRALARTGAVRRRYHRATALTWVLCLPYLVVSFVGGLWTETARLLMPVLLVDYLVAFVVFRDNQATLEPLSED